MSKVCAAKYVVSRKTPAQGVVTPARKSTASASAPITSSLAAEAAATAKLTPAYANNTADNVEKKRIIVTAARPASRSQQSVCVVQCAIHRSMPAAKTAENRSCAKKCQVILTTR